MGTPLSDQVVIVTGASKGIGAAIARGVAAAGASVAVSYKNDADGADQVVRDVVASGGAAVMFQADIGTISGVRKLVADVLSTFGKITGLVNNAARTRFGPLEQVTDEDFDDVVNTILRGPFFGSIAAAAAMRQAGGGSIVNITSISVRGIMRHHGPYTMAKGGLEAMTRQLAFELAPTIRVNAIGPTATITDRNRGYDPRFGDKWARVIPLGRSAVPEDYIGPTVFLLSDQAAS